jgi:drug/metabolite transporter (DMT)-like permease
MRRRPELPFILAAFAGVYLIWGTTYLATAFAIRSLPPFVVGSLRFMSIGLVMYGWLRLQEPRPFDGLNIPITMLCGVLMSGVGNGFAMWAQQGLPSGITALFVASLPMFILLLDWAFFSRHPPAGAAAMGVVLGMAGVAVLTTHTRALSGHIHPIHIFAVMMAVTAWATATLLQRRWVPARRIANFTCLQLLAAGVFQIIAAAIAGEWSRFDAHQVTAGSLLALAYLCVFGTLIANNCYSYLIAHVPAQKVTTYALVNPVIALTLGAVILGERITVATVIASALVLAGVALVLLQGLWRRPAAALSRMG